MAAPATPTFQLNWLNTWYKKLDNIHNASIKASPVLSRVRFEKTGGEVVAQPFTLNAHRGDSGNFDAAQTIANQANYRNSAKYRWQVPYGEYVGSVTVTHRDIALSRQDRDAAAKALKHETDMVFKQRASNIMRIFFANVGNSLGEAVLTDGVLVFADRFAAGKLFQGDVVSFSTDNGTTGSITGSPGFVIRSESEVASSTDGEVTIAATSGNADTTPANPSGVSNGTYNVFRYGEWNASDTSAIMTQLQAYLPAAPSIAELHNVKRKNNSLLSGLRVPDSLMAGRTIGSKIKLFMAHSDTLAGVDASEIKTVVCNPLDWADAEEEFTSTVSREVSSTGEDGFSKMVVNTAHGQTEILSEPHCPQGIMFFLSMNQLVFHSPTGSIAQWADEEGSIIRRKETELVYEMTPVSYLAPVIMAPYAHGRQAVGA